MGDLLGESGAGVVTILDGARERDDDTLELIELTVEPRNAQLDAHQREQPGVVDRLDGDVVRARLHGALALNLVVPGDQEYHGDVAGGGCLLDRPADLETIHVREPRLAED